MRIVFLGTPEFAIPSLEAVSSRHQVLAVVTQPDKPVGRKQVLTPPPIKVYASERGFRVLQFGKIRVDGVEELKRLSPDIMITAAYGQILSQEIIDIAPRGIVNVHASILPKYRGAMPVQWAIIKGEKVSGVTTMQTDSGIDTGGILLRQEVEIGSEETGGELLKRLSIVGAELLIRTLEEIEGGLTASPQGEGGSYYPIIKRENCLIDFSRSAAEVHNLVRALNPAPCAHAISGGEQVKIIKTRLADASGRAGEVIAERGRLIVCCGSGAVEVLELQFAGGAKTDARSFLNGRKALSFEG